MWAWRAIKSVQGYCVMWSIGSTYKLVQAYPPKFLQSPMHTPFFRDTPWFLAHVFNVPLPNRLGMSFFFGQIFGVLYSFWDICVLRDPTFPAKKKEKKDPYRVREGHITLVCNFSGFISQKRRGHLEVCAVSMKKSLLRIVITWFQCRFDFGRWIWLTLVLRSHFFEYLC